MQRSQFFVFRFECRTEWHQTFIFCTRILSSQVFFDGFYSRFFDEFIKIGLISHDRRIVHCVDELIVISFIFFFNRTVESRTLFCRNHFSIKREQNFGYFTVYFMVIILIVYTGKNVFQYFDVGIDCRIILLFQCFFQFLHDLVRTAELNGGEEWFCQASGLIYKRSSDGYRIIYLFYYIHVSRIVFLFGKLSETFFLRFFCSQYIIVDDGFVHADRVLPVVGGACVFVGVLDTCFVAGVHYFFQHVETGCTYPYARFVGWVHSFFYFRYGKVTAGTSREPHNHGIVSFFQPFERDGKMFFGF